MSEMTSMQEENEQKDKYLTFSLGEETFGIDICYVTEIIGIQSITTIPDLPDFIKGIINLRGSIIPVLDVRIRFKKQELNYNDRTCIIVIQVNDIQVGLIVDKVLEVLVIPEEQVVFPPDITAQSNKYIKAIGKTENDVKLILNCEKLLTEDEQQLLLL